MARTPEQVKADDALTQAINDVYSAYWPDVDPEPRIMTGYMVLAHRTFWNDEGDQRHEYGYLPMNGNVPHHEMLGLLAYTTNRLHSRGTDDGDAGGDD